MAITQWAQKKKVAKGHRDLRGKDKRNVIARTRDFKGHLTCHNLIGLAYCKGRRKSSSRLSF